MRNFDPLNFLLSSSGVVLQIIPDCMLGFTIPMALSRIPSGTKKVNLSKNNM